MGRKVAKVAVAKAIYAIDKPYDYLIPAELRDRIVPGVRVLVPFGSGNRGSDAIVLSISDESATDKSLKAILAQLDENPVVDTDAIQLSIWMRERYFCSLYDCIKAMLPAGLYFSLRDSVVIKPEVDLQQAKQVISSHSGAATLFDLLNDWGGSGDMEQIRRAFGTKDPNPYIRILQEHNLICLETSTQRGIGDKREKLAVLALPAEEAMAIVQPKRKSAPLRYSVTEMLCNLEAVGAKELCYFTGASMSTLKSLEKSGILTLEQQEVFRRPDVAEVEPEDSPILSPEQQSVYEGMSELLKQEKPNAALLYGVTGSGKTQVYIRLIEQALQLGKSALVLVPEIILTPQLLRIFTAHFGREIAVLHSSLRAGERYDEWKRVRGGQARVVVGTRSAVFAPLHDLGLIILDEEQEPSYKSENTPRYHARDVAKYRCVQNKALLILGSATPSVETMYQARSGQIHLFCLTHRYNQQKMPQVIVADMKQELRDGNNSSISHFLEDALSENLSRREQSILFLNRRGAHRMVTCSECGYVPECPRCSVKLTYHSVNRRLMCHHCGYSCVLPDSCPQCSGELLFFGTGTQKVQEEVEDKFVGIEVLRMDADTVSASQPHEKILERFRSENIPVLVGTQMVAKGLDFPNVTLVGVVAPDLSLYVDDFRAAERTFSLLTQVIGRAGRGEKPGRAVIQTYAPEHEVIRYGAQQDYDSFYKGEIQLRKLRNYPPFSDLLLFTVSGLDEGEVLRACVRFKERLKQSLFKYQCQLLGPAPARVAKVNQRYRYHLTLSGTLNHEMRVIISNLLQSAQQEKENRGISIYADLNPYYS